MSNGNLETRIGKRRHKTVVLTDGTQVRLRSLLRAEHRQWRNATTGTAAQQFSDDVLIALCIVDDDGNQVISVDDALTGLFDSWDMADCQILLRGCFELCFPSQAEPMQARVSGALKNSSTTTGNGSSGDSAESAVALAMN